MSCPFCARIEQADFEQAYFEQANFDQAYNSTVVRFEPLNPVTPGHMLFVPWHHAEHHDATAVRAAMGYAARYAAEQREDFNLIASSGASATQTVPHIHVHYVPRRQGDGLALPWTAQQAGREDHR